MSNQVGIYVQFQRQRQHQRQYQRQRGAGGAALVIDYGSDEVPTDTLRGIASHRPVHPLHAVGHADLSVDVDFGAMRQVAG